MDQGQDRKLPVHIFVRTFFRELKQGDSITEMYCVIRNAYDTEWSFSILAKVDKAKNSYFHVRFLFTTGFGQKDLLFVKI